jgi:uncharacterized protein DUF3352
MPAAARRLLATALCALVPLVAVGCGGGSSSGASSPLDNALGYVPKNAPFVLALDTDPNGSQWKSLVANLKKFPFSGQVQSSLNSSLQQAGFDFNRDIKPILGNQAVIASPTVQGLTGSNTQVILALQAKDKGKLSNLLSRSRQLTKDGSSNGATLYKEKTSSDELAQKGDTLVLATTRQQLVAALQQRGRSDRLTESDFNSKLNGLPSDALARFYLDAQSVIDQSPGAARAKQVKWVGALRTFSFALSSQNDGLSIDFDAKTDPSGLTQADLPIATGNASPPVSNKQGEIGVGIRGLDQTERFAESVAKVVSPTSYGDFVKAKQVLSSRLGVNVDRDLIGQLSGNATTSIDLSGHYAVRANPKNPATFAKTLAKFARVAPSFAQGAGLPNAKLTRSHGLYKLTGSNGKTIYYGMVGKVFALSNDPSRLAQIASSPTQSVSGAKGAISLNADAGQIVSQLVSKASGGGLGGAFGGSLVSAPLGSLTGWADSSTSGITGHLKLQIR